MHASQSAANGEECTGLETPNLLPTTYEMKLSIMVLGSVNMWDRLCGFQSCSDVQWSSAGVAGRAETVIYQPTRSTVFQISKLDIGGQSKVRSIRFWPVAAASERIRLSYPDQEAGRPLDETADVSERFYNNPTVLHSTQVNIISKPENCHRVKEWSD